MEKSSGTNKAPFYICASTAAEARKDAIQQCVNVCSREYGRSLGYHTVDGVRCLLIEYREVLDTEVEEIRDC